ncbi:MAG: hypothetical protein HY741_09305 [Chloroflexi bacterium]|nr:hypothetical protein [Chloroflexota bacterium]
MKKIVQRKPQAVEAKAKTAPRKTRAVEPKAAKTLASKQAAPKIPVPPPNGKRKPPSITITRPEVTRPPLVILPPRKVEAPIGAPSILLPKGGQPITSLTPIFRWMYVGGATRYEIEWSHDAHFGRGHSTTVISEQTLINVDSSHALKPGTLYQWRVRGGNDAGWGPWSGAESFRSPENVTGDR